MESFLGKCLVRKAGDKVIICGVFIPNSVNQPVDSRDEMWATEILVKPTTIKFVNEANLQFSPEDFLENVNDIQKPEYWEPK